MTIDYNYFLTELQKLSNHHNSYSRNYGDDNVLALDKQFRIYLDKEPNAYVYQLWVIYTLVEFHDNSTAKQICEEWFEKFHDSLALIFYAFILEEYEGGIPTSLYDKLKIVESISKRDQSIISMYLGTYHIPTDMEYAITCLNESCMLFDHNVHCLYILGDIYLKRQEKAVAHKYYQDAVEKVLVIYPEHLSDTDVNYFSPDKFINEMILWSECSSVKFQYLQKVADDSKNND